MSPTIFLLFHVPLSKSRPFAIYGPYIYNLSTLEAEIGRSTQSQGQPKLCAKFQESPVSEQNKPIKACLGRAESWANSFNTGFWPSLPASRISCCFLPRQWEQMAQRQGPQGWDHLSHRVLSLSWWLVDQGWESAWKFRMA